jgi:hypothetical protein
MCERDIDKVPHNTAASLMAKLAEVMANLPRATVANTYKRFRRYIEALVPPGGDFLFFIFVYTSEHYL